MTVEKLIENFYATYNGRKIDTDGVPANQPYQCVDGFKEYLRWLGDPNYARAIGGDGYAHQIAYRFKENGYDKYFDSVGWPARLGDILVYGVTKETPYSHVSFFAGDAGNGRHYSWGQNQGSDPSFCTISLSNSGVIAILRPKMASQATTGRWNPDGRFVVGSVVRDPGCGFQGTVEKIDIANNRAYVAGCWLNGEHLEVWEQYKEGIETVGTI